MTARKALNGKSYAGNLHRLITVCVAVSALAAYAYLPPVEERYGVKVEIVSFPQATERSGTNPYAWPHGVTEVQAGAPRAFPVTLENKTEKSVSGELEVWMNDDWDVVGPQGPLTLAPGEKKELAYTGTARPRALNALYPVHARFTPVGAKKEDAPHPIAVFLYKNPHAPRPVRKVSKPNLGPQPKVGARSGEDGARIRNGRDCRTLAPGRRRRGVRRGRGVWRARPHRRRACVHGRRTLGGFPRLHCAGGDG